MPEEEPIRKIRARKRGNGLGFWFFKTTIRLFGLRAAYGFLYPVCLHYFLFDRSAVRATMAYVRRRFPTASLPVRLRAVYKLFIHQGQCLIDRYYALSGAGHFDVSFDGYEKIEPILADDKQGFILLLSHAGNWQVIMSTIQNLKRRVYLLMRPEDNAAVKDALGLDNESGLIRTISPEQFMGGVVEMVNVLKQGHMVAIMGDRSYGYASEDVQFLGDTARFPGGAFTLSAATGAPVVVLLPAKLSTRQYRIEVARVFRPSDCPQKRKREMLRERLQEFSDILERYVTTYPFQCFLFHDIWTEATTPSNDQQKDRGR